MPAGGPSGGYNGTSIEFWCEGEVRLSERGEKSPHGGYKLIELTTTDRNRMGASFGVNEEEEQFRISVTDYHIPGNNPDRAFHVATIIRMRQRDVARLHAYLGFLIDHGDLDREIHEDA